MDETRRAWLEQMRDRIVERYDETTGSKSRAHFAPLIDAILAELFDAEIVAPPAAAEAVPPGA